MKGRPPGALDRPPVFNEQGQRVTKTGRVDKRHANRGRVSENGGVAYATFSVEHNGNDTRFPWHVIRRDNADGKRSVVQRTTSSEAAQRAMERFAAGQPDRRPSRKFKHALRMD